MVFVNFYHNYNFFYLKYTFLSSNFEFIRWIVDLNYLRTSDKFYPTHMHFYTLDGTIQASCNAISTLDKIYPSDSDLSGGQCLIHLSNNRPQQDYSFRLRLVSEPWSEVSNNFSLDCARRPSFPPYFACR